jgi:hypothetical protein
MEIGTRFHIVDNIFTYRPQDYILQTLSTDRRKYGYKLYDEASTYKRDKEGKT